LQPDSGTINIAGVDLQKMKLAELARFRNQHIGFIFQFHQLLPEFTALENVMIPGIIAGQKHKDIEQRAKELLDFMGLTHRLAHKPNELSGGENQRVAVARALLNKPDVILADEPTGSLDSANRNELYKLFFDLRDNFGQTLVIVTHDEELSKLTDRTIHLLDGSVV
jgi:lipoprotein-releasing system ATP-binding protein